MGQAPYLLNQRVFKDIDDLTPFGFAGIVRSLVCPSQDVCTALQMDKDVSPTEHWNMRAYWVDILNIPGRISMGP